MTNGKDLLIMLLRWLSCSMIYKPSFMNIGEEVQSILWFCLSNLRGSNVGITDGRDLRRKLLRWAQVP
jgi:hypothetical protein